MNERLTKFGIISGMLNYVDNETPRRYFISDWADEADLEQFAELIIRECAEVAGCHGHVSGFTLGDIIKEHFGVE